MTSATTGGADESEIAAAVTALKAGAVVAVPTDTVYGVAVDPGCPGALAHLFALKARPIDVPVPLLVGSRQEADLVGEFGGAANALADRFWPGGLTLVVPRASRFDVDLGGSAATRGSVGVRWPDHPVVTRLCRLVGPLAVTSANLHGTPPATTALEVASQFPAGASVAVVLDGGVCDRPSSTVVDCTGPEIRCLRHGTVDWELIRECVSRPPSGRTDR